MPIEYGVKILHYTFIYLVFFCPVILIFTEFSRWFKRIKVGKWKLQYIDSILVTDGFLIKY